MQYIVKCKCIISIIEYNALSNAIASSALLNANTLSNVNALIALLNTMDCQMQVHHQHY